MTNKISILEETRMQLRGKWSQMPDVPGMFFRFATVCNIGETSFYACRINGDSPDNQWYGIVALKSKLAFATGSNKSEAAITALDALIDQLA